MEHQQHLGSCQKSKWCSLLSVYPIRFNAKVTMPNMWLSLALAVAYTAGDPPLNQILVTGDPPLNQIVVTSMSSLFYNIPLSFKIPYLQSWEWDSYLNAIPTMHKRYPCLSEHEFQMTYITVIPA